MGKNEERKELTEQSGKFLGELQQALLDALQKRADEVFHAESVEGGYWRFKVTLVMEKLDSTFTEVIQTHTITSEKL